MITLDSNEIHALEFERIKGAWWFTLRELKTGMAYIVINHNIKAVALGMFKGMTLEDIAAFMKRADIEPVKMYKAVQ